MPDQTKKSISATQSPALFNISPYATRWMLWKNFHDGMAIDGAEPNSRMQWGKLMQPLLLQQAAADLKFEVVPNDADDYVRRGLLGCTRDAVIICPDRGPGALETKCVFDYRTWMQDWGGGDFAPKHYEIQLQQQIYVGGVMPYTWGVLAAWVAGEMHYFERSPIPALWEKLEVEAKRFFWELDEGFEPNPFGSPIELPWLNEMFPTVKGKSLDLSEDGALADIARAYKDAKETESSGSGRATPLRAKLLAAAKDADELVLASGVIVRIRPHGKGKRVTVFVPDTADVPRQFDPEILMAG